MMICNVDVFSWFSPPILTEGMRKHNSGIACSSGLSSGSGINCSHYYLDLVSHSNRCGLYNAPFKYG